ncbi:MAG: hypothetical protein IIB07_08060 [Bacteroidetes bacterium]|nr:hypothetical protein [Bacteroidota bacterium]MCH8171065.1 hypothetical protein [Bacteroidota bacterium]MCH8941737.1 hypothetical protein [Bacteroidota bacterium]
MDEKILQYLDGQLTKDEKILFEKELNSSPELKKKYEEYISVQSKLNEFKDIKVDETYFNRIVPEFRKRLEIKKKTRRIFSFSFVNSLAAIILLYFVLSPNGNNLNLDEAVKNWTENDFNYAIEYVDQQNSGFDIIDDYNTTEIDSVISSMLTDELNLSNNSTVYNTIDYNTLSTQMNSNDINDLYKEILNKKYF